MTAPAEQPSLRQRIADALTAWAELHGLQGTPTVIANAESRADAVLGVVQPELDQLRAELDDLHGRLNDIESLCDHAESDALATWQDPQPVPQWATDVRAICRREPAPTT